MKIVLVMLKKTLFWSYERGTWQYDLLCVAILAFIFFMPNSLFRRNDVNMQPASVAAQTAQIEDQQRENANQPQPDSAAPKKTVEPIKTAHQHRRQQGSR